MKPGLEVKVAKVCLIWQRISEKKAGEAALKKGTEKAGRRLAYVFSGKTSKTRNHKEKYLSEARTRS